MLAMMQTLWDVYRDLKSHCWVILAEGSGPCRRMAPTMQNVCADRIVSQTTAAMQSMKNINFCYICVVSNDRNLKSRANEILVDIFSEIHCNYRINYQVYDTTRFCVVAVV